jgi:hypothetical protein
LPDCHSLACGSPEKFVPIDAALDAPVLPNGPNGASTNGASTDQSGVSRRSDESEPRPLACYGDHVAQRELQVFQGFEAADRADDEYYAALAPQERLEILLDLVAAYRESTGETSTRLERVYRVTELSRC